MKLAISTLLASVALLSPQALAIGDDNSIDLQYAVRDAEALYGVATANGDLRFFNQGPSATKLRWFDPLRGEEEVRVLHPGQALLSQGHFGVPVSEGTIILVEKVGPGPISTGLASIPTASQFRGCIPTDPCTTLTSQQGESNQMHDSVHCLHNNGAFLPWHRGYFAPVDTLVGGTMCSIESYRGILGVLSSSLSEYKLLLGDGSVRFIGMPPKPELEHGPGMHDSVHCTVIAFPGETQNQCQGACYLYPEASSAIWTQTLEHGPGMHDSVHCIVGGTMCSASTSGTQISFTHHANIDKLLMVQTLKLESGHPLPFVISLEGFIVPTEGDDIFMPNAEGFFAGIPSCPEVHQQGSVTFSLLPCVQAITNAAGIPEWAHSVMEAQGWQPCPDYEPLVQLCIGYEPAGQVYTAQGQSNESIWGAGPINSYWDWTMEPTTLDSWTVNKLIAIIAIAPDGTVDL